MKPIITTIANQKGGVGKTTTAQNLGSLLANQRSKVLLIDLDQQGSLTLVTGVNVDKAQTSDQLLKGKPLKQPLKTSVPNLDIVPASPELALINVKNVTQLRTVLGDATNYRYIVIDTPPALSKITTAAMFASDYLILPAQADLLSLNGLLQLNDAINAVKAANSGLPNIAGILITDYDGRSRLSKQFKNQLQQTAKRLNTIVFKNGIRRAVAVKEAQATQQPLNIYAKKAKPAQDYITFTNQFKQIMKEGNHHE